LPSIPAGPDTHYTVSRHFGPKTIRH